MPKGINKAQIKALSTHLWVKYGQTQQLGSFF